MTNQTIAIGILEDTLDELDETLQVTLSNPTNATLGATTTHTYTITDNDNPPSVTLGLAGSPVAEAAGVATVTATLSTASGQPVTVNLAFSGTAAVTTDYTRSGTSIVILLEDPEDPGVLVLIATLTVDEDMKSLWCMREKNRTHPIAQAVRKEVLFLFDGETARAVLAPAPPSPKTRMAGSLLYPQSEHSSPSSRS